MTISWKCEADLAAGVAAWLRVQGWDVYPEVCIRSGAPRADIVATRGKWIWVVECKVTFGLGVIAQALEWLRYSHLTSVAVPPRRSRHGLAEKICRDHGIGIIKPGHDLPTWGRWGYVAPKLRRRCDPRLRNALTPEHKGYAPGNADHAYHTPFRATCKAVREFVRRHPGSTIRQVVEGVRHHYGADTNAINSLRQWVRAGKVPGVALADTRPLTFVPAEGEA